MKLYFGRCLSLFIVFTMMVSMLVGMTTFTVSANEGTINVLTTENAEFTIVSSAGSINGSRALDHNYATFASVADYNGVPIYDVNGNSGTDYIMLMTIASNDEVPMDSVRLFREKRTGERMYLGESTFAWMEGIDVYVSDTGESGSWTKVHSVDSLEGEMKSLTLTEKPWDDTDGVRYYDELNFNQTVTGKYLRIAIRNVEPWLSKMNIQEIEIHSDSANIPSGYHKLGIDAPENVEFTILGSNRIGEQYCKAGSSVSIELKPDDVHEVSSVKLNDVVLNASGDVYTFTMPSSASTIVVETVAKEEENLDLTMVSATVAGGEVIPNGVVPVITFNFNAKVGNIDKSMVLVNGQKNSELIQHAFVDATDYKTVYVVPFSDKLLPNTKYTISLDSAVCSLTGKTLSGTAQAEFTTNNNYSGVVYGEKGYIEGDGNGSFYPENDITLNEAYIVANRLDGSKDYSSISISDKSATRMELAQFIYIMKYGDTSQSKEDMFATLVKDGVIRGYPDGTYRAHDNVTRAEAVVLFNRAIGRCCYNAEAVEIFDDVPANHWAIKQITVAAMPDDSIELPWTENIPEVEYDVYNEKNDVWEQIPVVSQELRDAGVSGGEGGQWMQAIEVDNIDGQLLFAGVDIGGLMRSTDGGASWHRSYRGMMSTGCVDIAIDPNNKNNVLAIGSAETGSPNTGIYFSDDMGETWTQVYAFLFHGQRDTRAQLAWDKSSYDSELGGSKVAYWSTCWHVTSDGLTNPFMKPNHFFSHNTPGLIKTEDGGRTWSCVNSEMSDSVVAVHPTNGTVYVGNERGFHRSVDGGKTFTTVFSGEPIYGLDVIETMPDNVYINDSKGVLISTDCGKTFTRVSAVGFPEKENLSDVRNIIRDLEVSPANPQYMLVDNRSYLDYKNVRYYSHDGGKTWAECGYDDSKDTFFNHNRQHPFAWHPTDENKVWSLGGDWIVSSTNAGETFVWDANGYCGTPPGGRVNFYPFNTDIVYASVQDLFGVVTTNGGYTWDVLEAPSGFGCAYGSYTPDGNLLVAGRADHWYEDRYINVSRDGGETWTNTGYKLKNGLARPAMSFWGSVTEPETIFAGEYVSRDNAETWEEMVGCDYVLAQNYFHNREIWGVKKAVIVVSYDNGRTWLPFTIAKLDYDTVTPASDRYTSPGGLQIWDMEYDGVNDILYYLPGSSSSGMNVVRVEDNIHTSVGHNLLTMDVQDTVTYQLLAIDHRHPEIIYVGGYLGQGHALNAVQRSCDGGNTFQILSSMGDSKSIVPDGPSAGSSPETLVVKPDTGELWMWDRAEGFWKFPAPYEN